MTRPFWWHEGKWVSFDPKNRLMNMKGASAFIP